MKNTLITTGLFIAMVLMMPSCIKQVQTLPNHSIKLTFESATIPAGFTKQLVCQGDTLSDLLWSSTDSTVVAVSTKGLLTAYKAGQATITVKSKSYNASATCAVTVTDQPVTDVSVGADGSVFVIGADSASATGGFGIYKYYNSQLHKLPECAGVRIAVDPHGMPWVVNKSHLIFRYHGTLVWEQLPGTANDIGIGADGSVYIIGTQDVSPTGGYNILKWNGSGWDMMPDCAGIRIAVDPNGTPWVVNKSSIVFKYGGTYLWEPQYGIKGNDIGIGAQGSVYVTGQDSTAASYQPPIYKFNASSEWSPLPGLSGVSISVDPQGKIWYIDKVGVLHHP